MSLKSFIRDIQELKGGIGSISRRSFEVRISQHHHRSRSHAVPAAEDHDRSEAANPQQQQEMISSWANMPPELLRDIIQRLESSENAWPSRKYVVACAAVCSTWREITKDLVKAPEVSGKITFPLSLKQPGPKEATVQCYIKRDRIAAAYRLFLGLSPTLMENGKFLLAARKFRRATSTDYVISTDPDDMSRSSNSCVGKLRSNFLGTKFSIYDSQAASSGGSTLASSVNRSGRRVASKQTLPKAPTGNHNVAHISYELNVLGTRGPRRMQCTLHKIAGGGGGSASSMNHAGEMEVALSTDQQVLTYLSAKPNDAAAVAAAAAAAAAHQATVVADSSIAGGDFGGALSTTGDALVLKNKSPRWHDQLQCWCLNFRGRVTVASVKNFQLVAGADQPGSEQEKVLLQFGKIGKDMFTMDYRYPLSAFQAFAICLSSFDTKLACE